MQKTMALALLLACGSAQVESIPLVSEHATFVVRVVINDRITLNFTIAKEHKMRCSPASQTGPAWWPRYAFRLNI